VAVYNGSVPPDAITLYERSRLDGCSTQGLSPPKSNWALPLDSPPFQAYPLRPGITFTYYGVGIDSHARVARHDGSTFRNVLAAGEAMAGNILRRGYLAGVGMTIGTVFGRLAGEEATRCV
jgi:tricarballylate dehydrogenase